MVCALWSQSMRQNSFLVSRSGCWVTTNSCGRIVELLDPIRNQNLCSTCLLLVVSVHPAGVDVVGPVDARLGGEGDPRGLDGEEGGRAVLGRVARLPRRHVVELGRLERADQLQED